MSTDAQYYRLAMRVFANISGAIAVPAVLAALLGKWLDAKFDTSPTFIIILMILALALTAVSIKRKAKYYGDEFERLNNK